MTMRTSLLSGLVFLALAGSARADECPHAALFEPAASGSRVDSGFTGLNHGKAIFGDTLPLAVTCAATTPPCGVCTVTGIAPEAGGTQLRCTGDTSVACTIATEVADCGAPGTCRYFLSPPQPTAVSGVTACYTNEVTGTVGGTTDTAGGDLAVSIPYLGKLFAGGAIPDACVNCAGDPTPNDGLRGGTCSAGPRSGLPCDANGISTFPNDDFGASSFDCPSPTFISSSTPGPLALSTLSQSRTLSAVSPQCRETGYGAYRCLCDTCNDAAGEPCAGDADCPPSGGNPGVCGGRRCIGGSNNGSPCAALSECPSGSCARPGEPTRPNQCLDDPDTPANEAVVCLDSAPVGDGEGTCAFAPIRRRRRRTASGSRRRGAWKWTKGAATTKADFGDPLGSDTYALCLYDSTGRRATFRIPAGGICGGKPCWTDKPNGFGYKNRDAAPQGITKLTLKAGDAGKAQVQAQGQGDLLPMPPLLSLTSPLQVQLRNVTSGLCWGAPFSAPFDKHDGAHLKAKSD